MLSKCVALLILTGITGSGLSACAMTRAPTAAPSCTLDGAELLPAGLGGQQMLCARIAAAMAPESPSGTIVRVRVLSPSLMAATTTLASGRSLPEVKTGVSDQRLNLRSFDMLAQALAAQIASLER